MTVAYFVRLVMRVGYTRYFVTPPLFALGLEEARG
jgi:hypothetical protein